MPRLRFYQVAHPPPSRFARFFVAVMGLVLAFGIRYAVDPIVGERLPFMFFVPATMFAAWYGGLVPGTLVVIGGLLLGNCFFIEPLGLFKPHSAFETELVSTYVISSLIAMVLFESLHRQRYYAERLLHEDEKLEREIQERLRVEEELRHEIAELRRTEAELKRAVERSSQPTPQRH